MSGIKLHAGLAIILSILQWLGGLYLFYTVRVINDLNAALQALPIHAIIAIIFFIILVTLLFRAAGRGAGRIVAIPLILLVIQGIIGLVILLAIYQMIMVDLGTVGMVGLYVHNPLGLIVTLTTIYAGIKLMRGG